MKKEENNDFIKLIMVVLVFNSVRCKKQFTNLVPDRIDIIFDDFGLLFCPYKNMKKGRGQSVCLSLSFS